MMKSYTIYVVGAAMTVLAACGDGSEQVASDVTAARAVAVEYATRLVATDHADTIAMQRVILEARAAADRFTLAGDTASVTAFDDAFAAYLRDNDTDLYHAIF